MRKRRLSLKNKDEAYSILCILQYTICIDIRWYPDKMPEDKMPENVHEQNARGQNAR